LHIITSIYQWNDEHWWWRKQAVPHMSAATNI